MRKSFSTLKNKMSPTAKKAVEEKTSLLLDEEIDLAATSDPDAPLLTEQELKQRVNPTKEVDRVSSLPNKETAKAIEEARKGQEIVAFNSIDDMFEKLGI